MGQLGPTMGHLGEAHSVWLPRDGALFGGLSLLFFMSGSGGAHHTDRQNLSRLWGSQDRVSSSSTTTHTVPSYHFGGLDPWVPALTLQEWSLGLQALSFPFLHLGRQEPECCEPRAFSSPLLAEL